MGNFMKEAEIVKQFSKTENTFLQPASFFIQTVGYHDFQTNLIRARRCAFFMQSHYSTIHFVLSGKGTLEMGGAVHSIQEGQMFFIPPRTEIRYYPDESDPWEYIWFSLRSNVTEELQNCLDFSLEQPVRTCARFPEVKNTLRRMMESLQDGGGSFTALSAFYEILEICSAHTPHTEIRQIKQMIDQSFTSASFSIERLCKEVNISHAHLLRLFKNAYGITIKKYVLQKRMELACELLSTTELSVRSVALSCGFTDELHFMKTFKNNLGISALRYRKQQTTEPTKK